MATCPGRDRTTGKACILKAGHKGMHHSNAHQAALERHGMHDPFKTKVRRKR